MMHHALLTVLLCCAVAFRIYDLDKTGDIQPGEVVRLLAALLQNNPDIALDDTTIQQIVSQVGALRHAVCGRTSLAVGWKYLLCENEGTMSVFEMRPPQWRDTQCQGFGRSYKHTVQPII